MDEDTVDVGVANDDNSQQNTASVSVKMEPLSSDEVMVVDDEESDDEILAEYDVVLCSDPNGPILNLQYPMRDIDMKLEQAPSSSKIVQTRFRPKHNIFEIKTPLRTDGATYSREKGALLAANARAAVTDGVESAGCSFGKLMDLQTLVGTASRGRADGSYAVGFVHKGKIYLNPVERTVELRNTLSYLNTKGRNEKNNESAINSASSGSESEQTSVSAVRVKFGRTETAAVKKRRETSAAHHQKLLDEDPWVQLDRQPAQGERSIVERRNLVTLQSDESSFASSSHSEPCSVDELTKLLRIVVPPAIEETQVAQKLSLKEKLNQTATQLPLFHEIMQLPLEQRVRMFILKASVARFDEILSHLALKPNPVAALEEIEKSARLVNGCWTVKSDILYPERQSNSANSDVPGSLLGRAMDFVLYHFYSTVSSAVLTKREVMEAMTIPSDDLHRLMTSVAVYDTGQHGWKFKLNIDQQFLDSHPDCAQRQREQWEQRWHELKTWLLQTRSSAAAAISRRRKRSSSGRQSQQQRRRTQSGSGTTDTPMTAADVETPASVQTVVNGVAESGTVPNGEPKSQPMPVRVKKLSAAAAKSSASPKCSSPKQVKKEPNDSILNQPSASTSSADGSTTSDLNTFVRQFIFATMENCKVMSLSDLRRQLLVKAAEAFRSDLTDGVTSTTADELITRGASELDITLIPGRKNASDPSFVSNGGSSWPELRRSLVRFLKEKTRGGFRAATFKQFFKKELTDPDTAVLPDDAEMKKILQDYCDFKSGIYTLKTNS